MQNNQTNTFLKGMNLDVAKEFVSSDQYIDAMNVHVVSTDGNSSGTLQMYSDLSTIDSNTLKGLTILGTTTGHIYNPTYKCKQQCFIVLAVDAEGYNHLKVYDPENTTYAMWWLKTKDLKFNSTVKLVNLYENSDVSRVYICQKDSYISVVNINDNESWDIPEDGDLYYTTNGYDFSIFPQCGALKPFEFHSSLSGNKKACKVQYAYQLFDKTGKTTALSAISHTMSIGNELQDDLSTEGVCIKVNDQIKDYQYARIFSINYYNFQDLPNIYIKDEISINNDQLIYEDVDDTFLSTLTIEEFQSIKSAVFKASTLEIKDNRLFAADITEDVFDVDFDARVYQADQYGTVDINGESVHISEIINGSHIVEQDFVFNNPDVEKYRYGNELSSALPSGVTVDFNGFLSEVLNVDDLKEYEIKVGRSTNIYYADYSLTNIEKSDFYVNLVAFPPSCVYFVDYSEYQTKQDQTVVIRNSFWCGLDVSTKTIYKLDYYVESEQNTYQDLYGDRQRLMWHSLSDNKIYAVVTENTQNKYRLALANIPYIGGAGPNVEYSFIYPMLYAEENVSFSRRAGTDLEKTFTSVSTNNQLSVSRPTSVSIISNHEVTDVQISDSHKVSEFNYSDPYVCANFTGFKQGEFYRFGIIFYNKSHIPSPVHYIGSITIPYKTNTYGTLTNELQNGSVYDLGITPTGIRFKINLDNLSQDDRSKVVAYEIVREQKTPNTRKVLFQGILSRTLPFKTSDWSIGEADLRSPLFPTSGDTMMTTPNTRIYGDVVEINKVKLINDYSIIVSPEVSINKENINQSLNYAKQVKILGQLHSLLYSAEDLSQKALDFFDVSYDDPQYWSDASFPISSHLTYATAIGDGYKIENKYYTHNKAFGTVHIANTYAGGTFFSGMPLRMNHNGPNDGNTVAYALYKFYTQSKSRLINTSQIDSIVFCKTLPIDQIGEESKNLGVIVGDKTFVNTCHAEVDKNKDYGQHCNCLVVKFKDLIELPLGTKIGFGTTLTRDGIYDKYEYSFQAISKYNEDLITRPKYLTELHKDWQDVLNVGSGANATNTNIPAVDKIDVCTSVEDVLTLSQLSRLNFVSTGQYKKINDGDQIDVFGGDTYLCIHKELWCAYGYSSNHKTGDVKNRACVNIKYPVETRINLDRVAGPNFDSSQQPNVGLAFEPSQSILGYSQELPLNAYNDAYSAQEYNKVFVTKGTWDIENQRIGNRIVSSEVKSMGELTDSFQNFKIANYIDVDGQYGDITNLVNYNGKLYYLQATAFGTVAINERSLITDNNQAALLLGTGDVLSRFDYISTFNGSKHTNDPSIIVSPSSLYWYDSSKHSLLVFNQGGLNSLSKVKQVQTYFDNVVKDSIIHSGYDHRYNEVWFSPETDSKSMIYSEQTQAFVGFYAKTLAYPQTMESFSFGLSSKQNAKFIKFGVPSDVEFKDAYVQFVVNTNPALPKVYDTVVVTDCGTPSKLGDKLSFDLQFETVRQGVASQTKPVDKEGVYYTVVGRDSNKERMRDKIMTVKLTLNTDEFHIPSVSTMFRYSRI